MSKRGKNEGCIRKRKDNLWEAIISVNNNGTTKKRSVYAKDRTEAKNRLNELLNDIQQKKYIEPSKVTVKEWLEKWFEECVKNSRRPSTASGYFDIIQNHLIPYLGKIKLQLLEVDHVQGMISILKTKIPYRSETMIKNLRKRFETAKTEDKLEIMKQISILENDKISAITIKNIIVMLGTSLEYAMKSGLINKNVAKMVEKPKVEHTEIEYLTVSEQIKLLAGTSQHRLGFAIELCLATGVRQSELLGLKWESFNEPEGIIKINNTIQRKKNFDAKNENGSKTKIIEGKPKTKKGLRDIPLPSIIIEKFKKHRTRQQEEKNNAGSAWQENGFVFTSVIGTPVEPRKLSKVFHVMLKSAGIRKMGIHSLRHTFATRAVEARIDYKTLSDFLGHEDVSTTLNLYIHSNMDEKKKQMEMLNHLYT